MIINSPKEDSPNEKFECQYVKKYEHAISLDTNYILHLCGSDINKPKIAAGISDFRCVVCDIEDISKPTTFEAHTGVISGVKFCQTNDNLLYSCSLDGCINLWDLRTSKNCVSCFKDNSSPKKSLKPLSSFDVNFDDSIICGGTELIDTDCFLLFWDIRSTKLLGGYWESHSDDITQVNFHPSEKDCLSTGSTDGIINIFDISESNEDDALLYSLNSQSSVHKVTWLPEIVNSRHLSCITHTGDLQLWNVEEAKNYKSFSRDVVAESSLLNNPEDTDVINIHLSCENDVFVLASLNTNKGELVRLMRIDDNELHPYAYFEDNKQVLTTSWYFSKNQLMITGGESGILTAWSEADDSLRTVKSLKMNTKKKKPKSNKPY